MFHLTCFSDVCTLHSFGKKRKGEGGREGKGRGKGGEEGGEEEREGKRGGKGGEEGGREGRRGEEGGRRGADDLQWPHDWQFWSSISDSCFR